MKRLCMLALLTTLFLPVHASAAPAGSRVPRISSISPMAAVRGTLVEVRGTGFGGGSRVQVTVGTVPAAVLAATGTHVRFRVPEAAPLGIAAVTLTNPARRAVSAPMAVIFDGVVHPTLDSARHATETIGPAGGAVASTTAGGITLTLSIPAGAVDAETLISLTPVSAIVGLPLSGGMSAAAHFEPSGLALDVPATLTIEFPSPPVGLAGFVYAGAGAGFTIVPASVVGSIATIDIEHFSGGGTGTPTADDFDALASAITGSLGPLTFGQIESLNNLIMTWELLFGADFCESHASCGAAMQKAMASLTSLGNDACAAGHADLTTEVALVTAVDSLRLLLDYEVVWDHFRMLDFTVGSGVTAPESLPINTNGQTSAHGCRGAILDRVVSRAIELAETAPFGTSAAGSVSEDESNVGWLFDLAALAQLLDLGEASTNALHAGETIIERLVTGSGEVPGAVAEALDDPFGGAPSTAQQPYVLTRANFDGTGGMDNLEWLYFLSVQAAAVGLESSGDANGGLDAALRAIIERGAERCLTDITEGRGDLNQGRNFLAATGILSDLDAAFVAAIEACPVRITISPATVTVDAGSEHQFTALVTGATDTSVTWSSSDAADPVDGLFTVPMTPGTYHVTAASAAHPSRTAEAIVTATSTSIVDVDVTPDAPGAVNIGDTIQFSAQVTGDVNTAVTWTATGGTVSSSGLFTATASGLASVTATSQADTDAAETVAIEVTAGPITVSVSPAELLLSPGASHQLAATVTGTGNTAVTWEAYGGTITPDGFFTAGSSTGQSYEIYAYSVADPTKWGYVPVAIFEPAAVTLLTDGSTGGHVTAGAYARNSDGSVNQTGDCGGAASVADGALTTQTCSGSNDAGATATATASQTAAFTSSVITVDASGSFDVSYPPEHLSWMDVAASVQMGMTLAFAVAGRPVDYVFSVTSSSTNSCQPSGGAGAHLYDQFGNAKPTTGTLVPGFAGSPVPYRISAGADAGSSGGVELPAGSSCHGELSYNVTLLLTPWPDTADA